MLLNEASKGKRARRSRSSSILPRFFVATTSVRRGTFDPFTLRREILEIDAAPGEGAALDLRELGDPDEGKIDHRVDLASPAAWFALRPAHRGPGVSERVARSTLGGEELLALHDIARLMLHRASSEGDQYQRRGHERCEAPEVSGYAVDHVATAALYPRDRL